MGYSQDWVLRIFYLNAPGEGKHPRRKNYDLSRKIEDAANMEQMQTRVESQRSCQKLHRTYSWQ